MVKRKYVGNAIISEYDQDKFNKAVHDICEANAQFVPKITFRTHVHNNQLVFVALIVFYSEEANDGKT